MSRSPITAASPDDRRQAVRDRALSWMQGGSGSANRAGMELALRAQQSAAQKEPSNPAPLLEAGRLLAELGAIEDALGALERAGELAPDDVEVLARLGQLQAKVARWPEVEATQRRILALDAGNARAHAELCWALRRLGRLDESIEAGRQAVEADPDFGLGYNHLTFALLAADDCAAALETCDACLARFPRDVASLAYRHGALHGVGRVDEAAALVDFERLTWVTNVELTDGKASAEAFNRELAGFAKSAPPRPYDTTQTVDLLIEPQGVMSTFRDMVNEALGHYLSKLPADAGHPFLNQRPSAWEVEGWATRLLAMGPQEHHYHQHGWVSGVYYVSVPASVGAGEHDRDGFLEFCRFPGYSNRKVQSQFLALPPKPGMLVLFPSYFYHRVTPFERSGDEPRISLAFNLLPTAWA